MASVEGFFSVAEVPCHAPASLEAMLEAEGEGGANVEECALKPSWCVMSCSGLRGSGFGCSRTQGGETVSAGASRMGVVTSVHERWGTGGLV